MSSKSRKCQSPERDGEVFYRTGKRAAVLSKMARKTRKTDRVAFRHAVASNFLPE